MKRGMYLITSVGIACSIALSATSYADRAPCSRQARAVMRAERDLNRASARFDRLSTRINSRAEAATAKLQELRTELTRREAVLKTIAEKISSRIVRPCSELTPDTNYELCSPDIKEWERAKRDVRAASSSVKRQQRRNERAAARAAAQTSLGQSTIAEKRSVLEEERAALQRCESNS